MVATVNIVITLNGMIPAFKYGGTERVMWSLGKELAELGHTVQFIAREGSTCPFARVIHRRMDMPLVDQFPKEADIAHITDSPPDHVEKAHLVTRQGNGNDDQDLDINTVFVSQNHASRFGSSAYVINGLRWEDYGKPDFSTERKYFHFLAKAAWRVKNVRGAIRIAELAHERLEVLGGYRVNFNMGFRITWSMAARFEGMVGGERKDLLINGSKGLLFPVLWHEPCAVAILESMYFGCPVFGTPYGCLPELVPPSFGCLSTRTNELVEAIKNVGAYDRRKCHEYAMDKFSARRMALDYLKLYEKVLNGIPLNDKPPRLQQVQQKKLLEMQ